MVHSAITTATQPLVIQSLSEQLLVHKQIDLRVARLDLLHPLLGGNKWFKLIPNLHAAKACGASALLSFGGAYSNHIHALAAAGALAGIPTIGVIRGEIGEIGEPLNPTLAFARAQGMTLVPVSRTEYRQRHDPEYVKNLVAQFGTDVYFIPEGGANLCGVEGCRKIARLLSQAIPDLLQSEIVLACGTGSTLAGLVAGMQQLRATHAAAAPSALVRGFAVLKGAAFLRNDIRRWLQRLDADPEADWTLETDYHFGGYARCPPFLQSFINDFTARHGVLLDPVYTGKLVCALYSRIEQDKYAPGSRIVLLHTGGLQGRSVPGMHSVW